MTLSKRISLKKLISLYWRVRIVLFSLRWAFGLHLGDTVFHKGEAYTLVQGVCRPRWTLARKDGSQYAECLEVNEEEFVAPFWMNAARRVRYGYWFYMTNWHAIWCMKGIEPWVRGCRIWG